MLRRAAVVAALVSVTACQMPSSARPGAIIGGSALAVVGMVVATPTPVDSDHNGRNDFILNDDWSGFVPGCMMMALGSALVLAALTSTDPTVTEAPVTSMNVRSAPTPMQNNTMPAYVVAEAPATAVAPALPELPTTIETLRLAQQVRTASARGKCDDAWVMWSMLHERDAAYAEALSAGPVLSQCTQFARPPVN